MYRVIALLLFLSSCALADKIVLDVPLIKQDGDNWCWAACSQIVSAAYGGTLSQREIVGLTVNGDMDACKGREKAFDSPNHIELSLPKCGVRYHSVPYAASMEEIRKELRSGHPVVVRTKSFGAGHYVTIYGIDGDTFYVWDTGFTEGKTLMLTRSQFLHDYGAWYDTIFTSPGNSLPHHARLVQSDTPAETHQTKNDALRDEFQRLVREIESKQRR
jgi:hypothetical protein